MEFLAALWLPILLCGVVLFFASFIAWNILPHHFGDMKKLANEDQVMEAISGWNLPAGNYMFPYTSNKQEQLSKEYQERYIKGPRGTLNTWDVPDMKVNLACTFLFFLITSAIIGYITHIACPPGVETTTFLKVFRIAGTIGILVHGSSGILNGIWFSRRIITDILDGIVYGLLIGLIFAVFYSVLGLVG